MLILVAGACTAAGDRFLFETFDRGWQTRWEHSNQKKYTGHFEELQRPHSKGHDMAITVSAGGVHSSN
jgi:hypothetical protein